MQLLVNIGGNIVISVYFPDVAVVKLKLEVSRRACLSTRFSTNITWLNEHMILFIVISGIHRTNFR